MSKKLAGGVEVMLPCVRLNIKELVTLRNVHAPPDVKCWPDSKAVERLLLLGLVEYKDLDPCPKKIAAADKARKELFDWCKERMIMSRVAEMDPPYQLRRAALPPQPERVLIATKAGVELLGGVPVKVALPKPTKANGVGCP